MHPVYLSIGSNAGESEHTIVSALHMLDEEFSLTAASELYRTQAQVIHDQADFLNCAVRFSASSDTQDYLLHLLRRVQYIESYHGRNRKKEIKNGPRRLDIDIILFGNVIIDLPDIQVPHKDYLTRRFVLIPLQDIDPDLKDPKTAIHLKKYSAGLEREHENEHEQGIYHIKSAYYNAFLPRLRNRSK
ncbi:MAG: 2-amino-4-hydroxy-6-hydroxymethyldihydropteridine diphosphokinase [Salinispira sp.]